MYHTNVLMAIGASFAVVCGAAIKHAQHREAVHSKLRASGHEIIEISLAQMQSFAGNLLELAPAGASVIALSTTAWRSLDAAQRRALEVHGAILTAEFPSSNGTAAAACAACWRKYTCRHASLQRRRRAQGCHNRRMLELGVKTLIAYLLGACSAA